MTRLVRAARSGLVDLLDFLLDRRCAGCDGALGRAEEVCAACDARVSRTGTVLCLHCLQGDPESSGTSGACPAHGSGALVLAGPPFVPPLDSIVHTFKFRGGARLGPWIGSLLPEPPGLGGPVGREYLLVPIPLHSNRRARRGYDQAALLAADGARRWGIPLAPVLARRRDTPAQAELGAVDRRGNLAGAFQLLEPRLVRDRPILLVDDVVTTGSTFLEAFRTLAAAGPSLVLGLAASHGGMPDAVSDHSVAGLERL